jgi:hypothetical protein
MESVFHTLRALVVWFGSRELLEVECEDIECQVKIPSSIISVPFLTLNPAIESAFIHYEPL